MVMVFMLTSAAMIVAGFMVLHVVVTTVRLVHPQLRLHAGATDRAQHCSSHRAPDGEQDSQQQRQPKSEDLHRSVR